MPSWSQRTTENWNVRCLGNRTPSPSDASDRGPIGQTNLLRFRERTVLGTDCPRRPRQSDFVGPRRSRAGANEGEHRRKGCHILAARNHLVRLSLRFADKPTNRKNAKATWQQSLPHVLIICVHPFLALSASHTTWPSPRLREQISPCNHLIFTLLAAKSRIVQTYAANAIATMGLDVRTDVSRCPRAILSVL